MGLSRVIARAQAEQLRVLATADDIAEATGDRTTASWLATATRDAHGRVRADATLAAALDQRWTQTAAAFATGTLNLAQARVIADALAALPKDLGEDLLAKAETLMLTEANQLGPRELRIFGSRLLEYLAPDIAEEADYQRLLDQERRAAAATRATLRRRGDGSTDLHARIPDLTASLLRTFLAAFTAPRRRHQHGIRSTRVHRGPTSSPGSRWPASRASRWSPSSNASSRPTCPATAARPPPWSCSSTTTPWSPTSPPPASPRPPPGRRSPPAKPDAWPARPACGPPSSAATARSSTSAASPVFSPAQRLAMEIRDQTCTETACTMPAAFCEAHHPNPGPKAAKPTSTTAPALPLPPPTRPRPRLERQLPPQRHHHLHPTPIAWCERRLCPHRVSRQALAPSSTNGARDRRCAPSSTSGAPACRCRPRGRPTDPGPSPAQRTWFRDGRSPPSSTSGAPPTTPAGTSTTTPTAPPASPDANRRFGLDGDPWHLVPVLKDPQPPVQVCHTAAIAGSSELRV